MLFSSLPHFLITGLVHNPEASCICSILFYWHSCEYHIHICSISSHQISNQEQHLPHMLQHSHNNPLSRRHI
nr:hypothetical protein Iba_chr13aCG12700 [Ipomoea batatas]